MTSIQTLSKLTQPPTHTPKHTITLPLTHRLPTVTSLQTLSKHTRRSTNTPPRQPSTPSPPHCDLYTKLIKTQHPLTHTPTHTHSTPTHHFLYTVNSIQTFSNLTNPYHYPNTSSPHTVISIQTLSKHTYRPTPHTPKTHSHPYPNTSLSPHSNLQTFQKSQNHPVKHRNTHSLLT